MKITFLGTNGWYDTATGNTICTLIETNKYNIVLDAGNGIYKLEQYFNVKKPVIMLISHLHIDHIEGLHILCKFKKIPQLDIYCLKKYQTSLAVFLNYPFTVSLKNLFIKTRLHGIEEGKHQLPFPLTVKSLDHSGDSVGYRLKIDSKTITYCCDTGICKNDKLLSRNSDLLIHECSYFKKQPNSWGHVSPEEVAKLAQETRVKKLILTHYDASIYETTSLRQQAEKTARKIFKNTIAAEDNQSITV